MSYVNLASVSVQKEVRGNKIFTYIFGPRGSGKTVVALGIWNTLTETGYKVRMIDEPQIYRMPAYEYQRAIEGYKYVILVNRTACGMELK